MKTITLYKDINYFETDRLIARQLIEGDLSILTEMNLNPEIMKTLGGVRTPEQSKTYLQENLKKWKQDGFGLWLWFDKSTGNFVGRGGLRTMDIHGRDEIEVAYSLVPEYWQKGLATEMAKACVEIAFEKLNLPDLICITQTTNLASKSVMQKAGFQYEKDVTHMGLPHIFYRLKRPRVVELIKYHKKWPQLFAKEAERLQQVLAGDVAEVHHIGSTAIINMPAKPIIDILLECKVLSVIEAIKSKLQTLGYMYLRRHVVPHYSFYTTRSENDMSYSIQIRESGDPQINRHVNFRDYLNQHPEEAKKYADLKNNLAKKFYHDIASYVVGKDKLVQEIDGKAKLWPNRRKDFCPANRGRLSQDWANEQLMKAIEANLNVCLTHFSQYLNQVELIRMPGYSLVNSGLPDETFNMVLDADFDQIQADKNIDDITDYFAKKQLPFSWWVGQHDKPSNLDKYLEQHGYQNVENNIAMYFDLDRWDGNFSFTSELKIVKATDEKGLHDFATKRFYSWIASVLTEDDPIEFYVGYVNDKPVARGLICYFAGIAGIYCLSGDPVLLQFCFKQAKQKGYHIAVLLALASRALQYEKLGYKKCGAFKKFRYVGKNVKTN